MRLKLANWDVVMREVPDEITLALNLSQCPNNCIGCHSPELRKSIGDELTFQLLSNIMNRCGGITCVSFMGGDRYPEDIDYLAKLIKSESLGTIKTAWYSGREKLSSRIDLKHFDYIKLGPYKEECGPLDNPNTNQRMYKVDHKLSKLEDITSKFWKK